jgi:hypothetical protein
MRYATEDEAKRQAIGSYIHGRKPRPEFDHVQHNPPNPILSAFRNDVADVFVPEEFDVAAVARSWIDGDALDLYEDMHDSSLIDHARKVLQRLANLTKTRADYRYAELQEIMDRMYNGGPAATKAEIEEWEAL